MKPTRKLEIIKALLSFDHREPDKTLAMWLKLEEWLINNQEMRQEAPHE